MKRIKRLTAIFLCIVMTLTAAPLSGFVGLDLPSLFGFKAEAATYSGTCGDNVYWSLDTNTGVLNISGTGEMYDFVYGKSPWYNYISDIKTVVINDGVTTVGDCAFFDCYNLTGVIFANGVTKIGGSAFQYCRSLKEITIPNSVTNIGCMAFYYCDSLTSAVISNSVTAIDLYTFRYCSSLTSIIIPDSVIQIGEDAFSECYGLANVKIGNNVNTIGVGAFWNCISLNSLTIPSSVKTISEKAFSSAEVLPVPYYLDIYYTGSQDQWNNISIGWDNELLTNATIHYDIYNLGDETYSFRNFKDSDSNGHCFGMSITSAGYYMGILDITSIGGNNYDGLYALPLNSTVKKPICYYQDIQGSVAKKAIVAGGTHYKYGYFDAQSDWNAVLSYVENYNYNDKGSLQIGFRKYNGKGHAVNFLRYAVVDGQARIYAYDNNCPDLETYFFFDYNSYKVMQHKYDGKPDVEIGSIALRSVSEYFRLAANADKTRYVYAEKDAVYIPDAEEYPMECGEDFADMVVFEIPEGTEQVTVIPLVESATFEYLGTEYSFGENDEYSECILTLTPDENNSEDIEVEFVEKIDEVSITAPSLKTINYGDILVLDAVCENLPKGYYVEWECDSGAFAISYDEFGTCYAESVASGTAIVTARVVDENGEAVLDADGNEIVDTIELMSRAGFFQKLISFFKNLFGLNRMIY